MNRNEEQERRRRILRVVNSAAFEARARGGDEPLNIIRRLDPHLDTSFEELERVLDREGYRDC
jgi:hypothetical protein